MIYTRKLLEEITPRIDNNGDSVVDNVPVGVLTEHAEMAELLEEHQKELKQSIEDIGGCDHSVGICCCGLIKLADDTQALLDRIKEESK